MRSERFAIASAAASFLLLACPKRTSLQDQTHTDVAIYLRRSWMLLQSRVLDLLHKDKSKAAGVSHAFLSLSLSLARLSLIPINALKGGVAEQRSLCM
jgi:sulfate adenylyltransferase subunit 1 (EFTu-like GTPase family)